MLNFITYLFGFLWRKKKKIFSDRLKSVSPWTDCIIKWYFYDGIELFFVVLLKYIAGFNLIIYCLEFLHLYSSIRENCSSWFEAFQLSYRIILT